ncbi:MAG: c-type cytochrome [Hyphococcus sp.]
MRHALFLLAAGLALAGCDLSPKSSYGFKLPDGDPEAGRQVFVDKQCASCHAIAGYEALRDGVDPEMTVMIGGMSTRIDTYGELVTSVINPSHQIARRYKEETFSTDGESNMRNYNDVLTVSELIDLVAFLQAQYTEFPDY